MKNLLLLSFTVAIIMACANPNAGNTDLEKRIADLEKKAAEKDKQIAGLSQLVYFNMANGADLKLDSAKMKIAEKVLKTNAIALRPPPCYWSCYLSYKSKIFACHGNKICTMKANLDYYKCLDLCDAAQQ